MQVTARCSLSPIKKTIAHCNGERRQQQEEEIDLSRSIALLFFISKLKHFVTKDCTPDYS